MDAPSFCWMLKASSMCSSACRIAGKIVNVLFTYATLMWVETQSAIFPRAVTHLAMSAM